MYASDNRLFRNDVGRLAFFFFFLILGEAHVGYFCAAKQDKQILHKQYLFPDEWNNLQAGYKLGCANAGFPLFLLWAQHIGPMSDVIKFIFSLYQA